MVVAHRIARRCAGKSVCGPILKNRQQILENHRMCESVDCSAASRCNFADLCDFIERFLAFALRVVNAIFALKSFLLERIFLA
jgi:hypothetical protein